MSLLCCRPHTRKGTRNMRVAELSPLVPCATWCNRQLKWFQFPFQTSRLILADTVWNLFPLFQLLHDLWWDQFKKYFPPCVFIPIEFTACKKNCRDNRSRMLSPELCVWSCFLQVSCNLSSIMALINRQLLKYMVSFHQTYFGCVLFASWQWELDHTGQVGNSKINKRQSRYTLNVAAAITALGVIE